jgi:hypothetical protein
MKIQFLAGIALLLAVASAAYAAEGVDGITAVSARISKDYVRSKQADGSFEPESYAFGEGGNWGGEIKDATIDRLKFIDVARVIAAPLAGQKYPAGKRPEQNKAAHHGLLGYHSGTAAL